MLMFIEITDLAGTSHLVNENHIADIEIGNDGQWILYITWRGANGIDKIIQTRDEITQHIKTEN